MNSVGDNALMLKVKDGDLGKLGLLFERYKKMLFGYYYNLTHNGELSEDLLQNVFVRILKYKHSFNGDGQFKTWMFHIARNVFSDYYKKNKRMAMEGLDDWSGKLGGDSEHSIEMDKIDTLDQLNRALRSLDDEKREVLVLSKLEELKYSEIGEVLGCSEGAVKVKVFRAMKDLKKAYFKIQNGITP